METPMTIAQARMWRDASDAFRMFEARNSGLQDFSILGLFKHISAIASTRSGWRFREGSLRMINGWRAVLSCGRCLVRIGPLRACFALHFDCASRVQVVPYNLYLAMFSPAIVNVLCFDPDRTKQHTPKNKQTQ